MAGRKPLPGSKSKKPNTADADAGQKVAAANQHLHQLFRSKPWENSVDASGAAPAASRRPKKDVGKATAPPRPNNCKPRLLQQ